MLRLIHFWRIAIVITALTIFYFLPSFSAKALGLGASTSCRTFLTARNRPDIRQYILGFATGANEIAMLTTGQNYLAGVTDLTLLDNVANYCASKPDLSLQQAARDYLQSAR
jgi:hypothetical protein